MTRTANKIAKLNFKLSEDLAKTATNHYSMSQPYVYLMS